MCNLLLVLLTKAISLFKEQIGGFRMKKLICILIILFIFSGVFADHLPSASGKGESTTVSKDTYLDAVVSSPLDVTGQDAVLVLSSFEVSIASGGDNARQSILRLTNSSESEYSNEIIRRLQRAAGGDKGLGGLIHVFDVSSQSGMQTYSLQHKTSVNNKNNTVRANVVAIGLRSAGGEDLPYSFCQITGPVATTQDQWDEIPGLTTDYISLPYAGSIYISSTINAQASTGGDHVGSWKLQYYKVGEYVWTDFGKVVSRTISGNQDEGLAMLVGLLEYVPAGDYRFRVVHYANSSSLETMNSNLFAMGLCTSEGTIFPAFSECSDPGVEARTSLTTYQDALNRPLMPDSTASLLQHAQFSMVASDVSDSPEYTLNVDNGASTNVYSMRQYISGKDDIQAGSIVGLTENLIENQSYLASLQHKSTSGVELTTYDISLVGIMLADRPAPGFWQGSVNDDWHTAANWFDREVPKVDDHVTIPDGCTFYPVIDQNASCQSVMIEPDAYCELSSGITLTVVKDVYLQEGSSFIEKGTLSLGGNVYVDIAMEKHIYHYMSTPVDNTGNSFSALYPPLNLAEGDDFFSWDEGDLSGDGPLWINIRNSALWNTEAFEVGRGYAMSFNEATEDQVLTFTAAAFNKGNYTVPVSRVAQNTSYYYSGWNLIGNPYPSNINILEFLSYNETSIWGAAYFWDEGPDWEWPRTSDYAAINELGSISTGGAGNAPTNYAGVGQAFMVYCTNVGTAQVSFTDDMRSGEEAVYFKNNTTQCPKIKLAFQHPEAGYNELLIGFCADASRQMDHYYDAPKMSGNPELSVSMRLPETTNSMGFCIQGLPYYYGESVRIPLKIYCGKEGKMELSVVEMLDFDGFSDVYLVHDDVLMPISELTTIEFQTETGSYDERYSLLFLNTNSVSENSTYKTIQVFRNGNYLAINTHEIVEKVRVYSIDGKCVYAGDWCSSIFLPKNELFIAEFWVDKHRMVYKIPAYSL